MKKLQDNVNNPLHYNKKGVECITAIEASMSVEQYRGALKANVIKYIWRKDYKGKALEDLKKAQWYLERLIKSHIEDNNAPATKEHHRVNRKSRRKVRSK